MNPILSPQSRFLDHFEFLVKTVQEGLIRVLRFLKRIELVQRDQSLVKKISPDKAGGFNYEPLKTVDSNLGPPKAAS